MGGKKKRSTKIVSTYNRQVICGYVSNDGIKKGYAEVARRINATGLLVHKVSVSALVGRVIERMLPFLIDQSSAALAREVAKEGEEIGRKKAAVGVGGRGAAGRERPAFPASRSG